MNHSHVKNLINLGYLVDDGASGLIEDLDENAFFSLTEAVKKDNPFIINQEFVGKATAPDIKIVKKSCSMTRFTVQEMVGKLNERYSALQNLLLRRVELSDMVSINKLSAGRSSIIGLVKEKAERGNDMLLTLEDPTGDFQVIASKALCDKLALDDVVAVSGNVSNKVLYAEKLMYPDIPIRPVKYSKKPIKVAFLEDGKEYPSDYVLYKDKMMDKVKNMEHPISSPCILQLGEVFMMVLSNLNPLDVLRKRYVSADNCDFIVDPVPDVIFTDIEQSSNYKGVTILSKSRVIDLSTRNVVTLGDEKT
jgi:hypothetical protein